MKMYCEQLNFGHGFHEVLWIYKVPQKNKIMFPYSLIALEQQSLKKL